MNSETLSCSAHLEEAQALIRNVLLRDFDSSSDAKSLDRILFHLGNIQQAVSASSESHVNAAKRLGDFALTAERISGRNLGAVAELTRLSDTLRAAGSGIQKSIATREVAPAEETAPA